MADADKVADVAGAFVDEYYSKLLSSEWRALHQFYIPSAVASRGDERASSTGSLVAGVEGIMKDHEAFNKRHNNAFAQLTVLDALAIANGILINVIGELRDINTEAIQAKFVQQFLLERDTNDPKFVAYYVRADIFTYLAFSSPAVSVPLTTPVVTPATVPVIASPAAEPAKETKAAAKPAEKPTAAAEKPAAAKKPAEPAKPKGDAAKAKKAGGAEQQKPAPAPTPAPAPAKPKTWANIAAKTTDAPAPVAAAPTAAPKAAAPKAATAKTAAPAKPAPQEKTTLRVTNIPDTTNDALEKVFSAYGKVVGSTVRPNFAFVDFAPTTNLATLLQKIADKPVVLQGRTLAVSEKKPQGQQQNRGGRGPRRESPVEPLDVSFNPEEYDSGHLLAE